MAVRDVLLVLKDVSEWLSTKEIWNILREEYDRDLCLTSVQISCKNTVERREVERKRVEGRGRKFLYKYVGDV